MMSRVSRQVLVRVKSRAAFRAPERPVRGVDPHVRAEVVFAYERLGANGTGELLVSGVEDHVQLQVLLQRELLVTNRAAERLLTGVDQQVSPQILHSPEDLVAHRALEFGGFTARFALVQGLVE